MSSLVLLIVCIIPAVISQNITLETELSVNNTENLNETLTVDYDEIVTTIASNISDIENEEVEEMSVKVLKNPMEFMDYFEDLLKRTGVRLEALFLQFLPQLLQFGSSVSLSQNCSYDILRIILGARELKPWAIKIIDSSGKIPDGILGGTLTALGSYDDCLESTIGDQTDAYLTKAQYCAINIKPYLPPKPPLDRVEKEFNDAADAKGFAKEGHLARIAPLFYYLKLRLGVCVPATCNLTELNLITHSISQESRMNVTAQNCYIKQSFNIENDQILPLCISVTLIVIIGVTTASDAIRRSRAKQINVISSFFTKCWLSFSMLTNSAKIFNLKVSENEIMSLHGLKVLSLVWIILAHTYSTLDYSVLGRLSLSRDAPKGLLFQFVMNASLAIETFFFLSGVLVVYTTLNKMKSSSRKWNKTDWITFYIHRYIRLTPAIILMIVLLLFAYRIGNGPLWEELIYPSVDKCRQNWWTHALYISNFIKAKNMCFVHLWYIAADMQLFLFTPIFITLLRGKPLFGQILLIGLIIASIVSTGVVTYIEQLPPTLLFNNPDPSARYSFGNILFIKAYPHAGPYLIGMLTGYLLYIKSNIQLSRRLSLFGWIFTVFVILMETFTTWQWNKGYAPSIWVSTLYASLFRVFWAAAMSWIVIACHSGSAGFVNSILSSTVFIPLSKVSYVTYLIHPGLMYVFIASTRNIFAFDHYFVIQLFFSHLTTNFILSFIFSLIIEYPFLALEHVIYNYFTSTSYGNKVNTYAVTQHSRTPSDISLNDDKDDNGSSGERTEKYRPFTHLNTIQFVFNKGSPITNPSKLVYKL